MANGKPGAPLGNKNAAKDRQVRKTLVDILAESPDQLRAMCMAQIAKAIEGDTQAFKEIRDTIDGKPHQAVSVDGGEGEPVRLAIERVIVRANQNTTNPDSGSI